MRLPALGLLLLCACATVTAHDLEQQSVAQALPKHRFPLTVDQAQTTLAAQLKWPAMPFGQYDVVLEPQPKTDDGVLELRVRITNQFADGRPSHLATIALTPDGADGLHAECTFEQPDANCSDWVWNALGGAGLDEAHAEGKAKGQNLVDQAKAKEEQQRQKRLAAYQVEKPGVAEFKPAWKSSFIFGLAMGGNEKGAAAGVLLRGGFRRQHTRDVATAYLLEYQFQGQSARPGGGWTSLVVPTFHVELPFWQDKFMRPPSVYVTASAVGSLDIDQAPGTGIGFRAGLGFKADWYVIEGYVQRIWSNTSDVGFNYFGVIGIGF